MTHRAACLLFLFASGVSQRTATAQPAEDPTEATPIDLLWAEPGCVLRWHNHIATPSALFRYLEPGRGQVMSVGSGVLRHGDRMWIGENSVSDGLVLSRFVEQRDALVAQVLAHEWPVLLGSREVVFQAPGTSSSDWLEVIEDDHIGADTTRVTAVLKRYSMNGGESVLEIDWGDTNAPAPTDIRDFVRSYAAIVDINLPGEQSRLYFGGRLWGFGPRAHHELSELRLRSAADAIVVHPGDIFPRIDQASHSYCAEHARSLAPTLAVPQTGELLLGPEALAAYGLPYVAANLRTPDSSDTLFPRYVRLQRGGLDLVIVAIVDPDQLEPLPARRRAEWEVVDPHEALSETLQTLASLPGSYPDLVVVVVATSSGYATHAAERIPGVDLVFGNFHRSDESALRSRVEIAERTPRDRVRLRRAVMSINAHPSSVGRVRVHSSVDRQRIVAIEAEEISLAEQGLMDLSVLRSVREYEEQTVARDAQLLLPDVAHVVQAVPELEEFARGDRILHGDRYEIVPPNAAIWMTDPLWMRFVTNVLRADLNVDAAFSRNLRRSSSTVGMLQRSSIEDWLQANDEVHLYSLTGDALRDLLGVLRHHEAGDARAGDVIFTSGLNLSADQIAGRPIDDERRYQIAITDTVAARPEIEVLLASPTSAAPRLLRDVVLERIESWIDPDTQEFDPEFEDAYVDLFRDHSSRVRARWDFDVEELALRGAFYRNTNGTSDYAASRESRVVAPENFSLEVRSDLGLIHDAASIGWETRIRIRYQRIDIGGDTSPQESSDDLLVSSELRLNAAEIDLGTRELPLVPFVRSELDTEFTATPGPNEGDPDFPHQLILRERMGLLLRAGEYVPEVRLGVLGQHDFSQGVAHDAGVFAALKLRVPMGPLVLQSDNQLRYLFEDSDDRDIDLGMVFMSDTRLVIPVGELFSLFAFADVFLVRGKVEGLRHVAGSVITGIGLNVSGVFRL